MQKLLRRRLWRSLKSNWAKTLSLFLVVVLVCYIEVSLCSAAITVIQGSTKHQEEVQTEDGEFSVFVPLTDAQLHELSEKNDISLEEQFQFTIHEGDRVFRVFKNRSKVNMVTLREGALPVNDGELVLEQQFAQVNGYAPGDKFSVLGAEYTVCGIGCIPDYLYPMEQTTDTSMDNAHFAWIIPTDNTYLDMLYAAKANQEYNYAFRFHGEKDEAALKAQLYDIVFDYQSYMQKDLYFKQYIKEYTKDVNKLSAGIRELDEGLQALDDGLVTLKDYRGELEDGIKELTEGNGELTDALQSVTASNYALNSGCSTLTQNMQLLSDSVSEAIESLSAGLGLPELLETEQNPIAEFSKSMAQMCEATARAQDYVQEYTSVVSQIGSGAKTLAEGMTELSDALTEYFDSISEAQEGTQQLLKGMDTLMDEVQTYIDETVQENISNTISYVAADDNTRMNYDMENTGILLTIAIAVGIAVFVLLAYICSITLGHQIAEEAPMLGALFALGVPKRTLVRHYVTTPVLSCLLGGVAGLILGYSPIGYGFQMPGFADYFSMPLYQVVYSPALIVYSIVGPTVICLAVNLIILNRKLSRPVVQLMRGTEETAKLRQIDLHKLRFIQKFQVRQMLREKKTAIGVFFCLLLSVFLVVFGVVTYAFLTNVRDRAQRDISFEYLYFLKYPSAELNVEGEKLYVKTMKVDCYGFDCSVDIYGIGDDSVYFPFDTADSAYQVVVSDAVSTKFNLGVGDYLVMYDTLAERNYAFKIVDICQYSVGLPVFMNIEQMRVLFGQSEDYYNAIASDRALNIARGRLFSVLDKEALLEGFLKLRGEYAFTYNLTFAVGAVLFAVILFMMVNLMVDRATRGISLVRILGYRTAEISRMYLRSMRLVVALSMLVAIPIDYLIVRLLLPVFFASQQCAMYLEVPLYYFGIILAFALLLYELVMRVEVIKIKAITPAVFLRLRS